MLNAYGLELEVEDLELSQRHPQEIIKRLFEINRSIIPRSSERAERIYKKLSKLFMKLNS